MVMSSVSFLLFALLVPSESFISPRASTRIGGLNKSSTIYRENEHQLLHLFDNDEKNNDRELSSGLLSNVLMPATTALEETDIGWVLAYADLAPETEDTLTGQAFLATNVAYTIMGLLLQFTAKDAWLGTLTELASAASFTYHYNQLANPQEIGLVRLTLMIDYVIAIACLGTSTYYLISDPTAVPLVGYIACGLAVMFLGFSWVWEKGVPYCFNHGLWHLFGAYGGYLIGQAHAGNLIA